MCCVKLHVTAETPRAWDAAACLSVEKVPTIHFNFLQMPSEKPDSECSFMEKYRKQVMSACEYCTRPALWQF